MKKLMIALSAAAMAFGLRAADSGFLAGNDFEDGQKPSEGWTFPSDDPNQLLQVLDNTDTYSGNVPTQWTDSDHDKFFSVKTTFGKPISLDLTTAQDMSDGAYFDSLVKMTVCDEAPAADYANAKIMVWAQENAEGTATSLWVRASAPDGEGWKSQDFECGAFAKADEWHRLTIKAIPDIYKAEGASDYVPGFVVYVDGEAISSTAAQLDPAGLNANAAQFNVFGQLFVSLDQGGVNKNTISSVGFDGQGSLDDVTLTSTAPDFAKDYEFFTIQGDNNVVSFKANDETSKDGVVQLKYTAGMTVQLSEIVFAEGYMLAELSGDTGVECDTDALTFEPSKPNLSGLITSGAAAAEFNGKPYATVGEAVEAANAIDVAGTYALKLFANADSTIDIENKNPDVKIEIDLAGKTVKGEGWSIAVEAGDVTIVDSVGGGKVEAGEDGAVVVAENAFLLINAGTYDGLVTGDGTLAIYDGMFLAEPNDKGDLAACVVREGYTIKQEGDYFVVAKDGWTLYLAQGANENEFLIGNEDDLIALATHLNESAAFGTAGVTFKQTADITLTKAFDGIGAVGNKDNLGTAATYMAKAFQGTYDGDGHTVSGIVLPRADYAGFFGSTYGAMIKNLTLAVKEGTTGFAAEGGTADFCGGLVVGVSVKTTIENVTTAAGTFKAQKAAAGIVGYAAGGTVIKDCVNNLNVISMGNEKVAGFVGCAQNTGSWDPAYVTIDGCKNTGNVECQASGKIRAALLVSYTDLEVKFQGNIVAEGTVTQAGSTENIQSIININGGSATVVDGAVIKAPANLKSTIHNGKAHAGLNYATVDEDGVATFVADAVVAGGAYKVMTTGNKPVIELKEGETITFNTELATIDATGITAESGCKIEATGLGQPITYTAVKDAGWNPDADPTVKAGDLIKDLPAALANVSFKQLSIWAAAKSVDFTDASLILPEAFLLNCANTEEAVEEAKAGFKFTSFDPTNPPTADDFAKAGYNGTVTIKSFSDAACTTEATGGDQLFYKAILTPTPAPVE